MKRYVAAIVVLCVASVIAGCAHTVKVDRPMEVTGRINTAPPPRNALVLFDGSGFSHFTDQSGGSPKWRIVDGVAEVVPQTAEDFPEGKPKKVGIQTKREFGDFQMHLEFLIPPGEQDNSGVYIQRRYEIQIVDSYAGRVHPNNCGAIYKQKQPDVIASMPPGEWQSYDIEFRAARFAKKGGQFVKTENARVTVYLNNVLVQDDVEILHTTGNGDEEGPEPAPILLQDHGCKTRFRNVWIIG
jgi:hypothetical protein